MAVVRNLMVRAGADFSGLSKGFKKAEEEVTVFKEMTKEAFKIIGEVFAAAEIIKFLKETATAYNFAVEQETKLTTIMKQRMNANEAMINSVVDLTKEQQNLGVIERNVQLAGAQQLATFLKTSDSLKSLIPAMNNLAAQQEGTNVTTEGMVNIGKAMGKVMDGNVGALKRLGISFTVADQHMLKYGTEQERAAALAKVVNNNVGQMNAALLNTPEGRMRNLKNGFEGFKEQIGQMVVTLRNLFLPVLQSALNVAVMVAHGLQVAFSVAYQFIQAIFGKTAGQTSEISKHADAVNGLGDAYAAAGAKAKGAVAGFDQVNTLASASNAGSGSSAPDALAGVEVSSVSDAVGEVSKKMQGVVDKVKEALTSVGDYFKGIKKDFDTWYNDVKPSLQSIADTLKNIEIPAWESFKKSMSDLGGTAKGDLHNSLIIAKGDINVLADLLKGDFKKAATDAWDALKSINWKDMLGYIQMLIDPIGTLTSKVAEHAFKWLDLRDAFKWVKEKMQALTWQDVLDGINLITNPFGTLFSKLVEGQLSIDGVKLNFKTLHDDVLKPLGSFLTGKFKDAIDSVSATWDELKTHTGKSLNNLSTSFGTWAIQFVKDVKKLGGDVFNTIVGFFKKLPGEIWTWLTAVGKKLNLWTDDALTAAKLIGQNIFDGIVNIVNTLPGEIWTWLTNIGTKLGDYVSDALTAAQNIGSAISEGIMGFVKNIPTLIGNEVNNIISSVTGLVGKVAGAIGSIFSGGQKGSDSGNADSSSSSSSFNMPVYPHASGGVFTKPTLLGNHMFGEAGSEAVVPFENTSFMDKMGGMIANAVMAAMKASGGNNNNTALPDIVLQIDGAAFARITNPYAAKESTRIGKPMIKTSGKSVIVTS